MLASTAAATVFAPPAPGTPPVPNLVNLTPFGNFTQDPNHPNNYTLDLGAVQLGEVLPPLQFSIENTATAPADQLTGTFSVASVAGYVVSGASIPSPIDAGQSYDGLTVQLNTGLLANTSIKVGANSETITFNPVDTNPSGFSAPLPPITLTIADTLEVPGMVYSQAWGDVHIITYNGLKYDFQATGDYILAKSRLPGDNFEIQLELEPWFAGASVTTIHQVAIDHRRALRHLCAFMGAHSGDLAV
jgi:von Willebrand factor type D domain